MFVPLLFQISIIGYSSNVETALSNARFTNSSGSSYTWQNATANNKIQAYMAYYDSSSTNASQRKYKYLATSDLEMDDSALRENKGYWVYANEAGNLTIPNIGGTIAAQTYAWSKLRFMNSSGTELNITQVRTAGWVTTTLQYYNCDLDDFSLIDNSGYPDTKNNISAWEGIFVYSYKDNITLIRQN